MGSPVVMRNPRKGHTAACAKTLAAGLKFCHVGIVEVAQHSESKFQGRPAFERVFSVSGLVYSFGFVS
jgi:hypothetical protein